MWIFFYFLCVHIFFASVYIFFFVEDLFGYPFLKFDIKDKNYLIYKPFQCINFTNLHAKITRTVLEPNYTPVVNLFCH